MSWLGIGTSNAHTLLNLKMVHTEYSFDSSVQVLNLIICKVIILDNSHYICSVQGNVQVKNETTYSNRNVNSNIIFGFGRHGM